MSITVHNINVAPADYKIKDITGKELQGEQNVFDTIVSSCKEDEKTDWHLWHDVRLPIKANNTRSTIQIDFILACIEGVLLIEVKGGKIILRDGKYFQVSTNQKYQEIPISSPFDQVQDYHLAVILTPCFKDANIYFGTACAFPHSRFDKTNNAPELDEGYKVWSKSTMDKMNFAQFAHNVLKEGKDRLGFDNRPYKNGLESIIKLLSPTTDETFIDKYLEPEIEIEKEQDALKQKYEELLELVKTNNRIMVKGAGGTGKTALAMKYINDHRDEKGLYICWNKLLCSRIRSELNLKENNQEHIEVMQYSSLTYNYDNTYSYNFFTTRSTNPQFEEMITSLFQRMTKDDSILPYDYIIVDEAQDLFALGVDKMLNALCNIKGEGLSKGRFLVFYDLNQAYNAKAENPESIIGELRPNCVELSLDHNYRVPRLSHLEELSNRVVKMESQEELSAFITALDSEKYPYLKSTKVNSYSKLRDHLEKIINSHQEHINQFILLDSYAIANRYKFWDVNVIGTLIAKLHLNNLSLKNSMTTSGDKLDCCTINSFKGLEREHVILLLDANYLDPNEICVGLTRTTGDVEIISYNV